MDMVVTIHNNLLTQWRVILIGQFQAIFLYQLLQTTCGSREFSKIRVFKVNFFTFAFTKLMNNEILVVFQCKN
jgi:hypothetical protein